MDNDFNTAGFKQGPSSPWREFELFYVFRRLTDLAPEKSTAEIMAAINATMAEIPSSEGRVKLLERVKRHLGIK
jgi:hypothetical protein